MASTKLVHCVLRDHPVALEVTDISSEDQVTCEVEQRCGEVRISVNNMKHSASGVERGDLRLCVRGRSVLVADPGLTTILLEALSFKDLDAQGAILEWNGDGLSLQLRKASACVGSWRRPFEWITVRVGPDTFQTVWLSAPQQPVERLTPNIESIINDFEHREYKCILCLPSTMEEAAQAVEWGRTSGLDCLHRLLEICDAAPSLDIQLLVAGLVAIEKYRESHGIEALRVADAVLGGFWAAAVFVGAIQMESAIDFLQGKQPPNHLQWNDARIPLLWGDPCRAVHSAELLGLLAMHPDAVRAPQMADLASSKVLCDDTILLKAME